MILRVVSGLAVLDGQILMGKRRPNQLRPLLWETPGGKVEPGESAPHALTREWNEELGIDVEVGPLISVAMFDLEIKFVVELYAVEASRETLEAAKPLDHTHLHWIEPRDAAKFFSCSPAFYVHYPHIREWMKTWHPGAVV